MAEEVKIGTGHAEAMLRAGFKELGQALQAFPGQGIQHVEEPGLFGNPTPQLVTQEMGGVKDWNAQLDMAAARGAGRDQDRGQGMER